MRTGSSALRWVPLGVALVVMVATGAAMAQNRDAALPGLDGSNLSEADLEQGTTIIVVWASWSPRSRDIVERVNQIEAEWGQRARVVTIDFQEDRATIEAFLAGKNLVVPVYMDSKGVFSKKHAVTTLPGILIYSEGQLAHRGRLPRDANALIGRILG
jgi:thiol-disulfide isomerase/thioredoxin